MLRSLELNGYPNISNEHILALLPRLWTVVQDLIPAGFTYDQFVMVAQQEYTKSKIRGT